MYFSHLQDAKSMIQKLKLITENIARKQNEIDREYEVSGSGDYITIRSIEEKSTIDLTRKK